jgi:ABC-2 type transport system permease protein
VTHLHAELRKLLTLPALGHTVLLTLAATGLLRYASGSAVGYVQAGFLVLGVLAVASEHQGGGQIRTTLLAMPHRLRLYAAKTVALAAVTTPVAITAAAVDLPAAAYLVSTTLLGFAAATLIRRAVPAVLAVLGAYFTASPLLRGRWPGLGAYLPDTAGWADPRDLTATLVWTTGLLAIAAWCFHRRDP